MEQNDETQQNISSFNNGPDTNNNSPNTTTNSKQDNTTKTIRVENTTNYPNNNSRDSLYQQIGSMLQKFSETEGLPISLPSKDLLHSIISTNTMLEMEHSLQKHSRLVQKFSTIMPHTTTTCPGQHPSTHPITLPSTPREKPTTYPITMPSVTREIPTTDPITLPVDHKELDDSDMTEPQQIQQDPSHQIHLSPIQPDIVTNSLASDVHDHLTWPNNDIEFDVNRIDLPDNQRPSFGYAFFHLHTKKKSPAASVKTYYCLGVYTCPDKSCHFTQRPTKPKNMTRGGQPPLPKYRCPIHPSHTLKWIPCRGGESANSATRKYMKDSPCVLISTSIQGDSTISF